MMSEPTKPMQDAYDDAADIAIIERLDYIGSDYRLKSRWCVDGVDDLAALSSNHPFLDARTVIYETSAFFGGPGGRFEAAIKGPTWLDLWKAANQVIRRSHDRHHVFVELFVLTEEPGVIRMFAGS